MLEELKKNQKIAYRILYNALYKHTLTHAYLFTGEKGTPKKEAAILLAQSILCDTDGFACGTCDVCTRVKNLNYADLIYVDGKESSIKKEDITKIQEQFSQTALEANGKKIYILDGIENATREACNSMLKFLEEPQEGTYAILICEHSDRVLETIVSRCQNVPFYKTNSSELECQLQDKDTLERYVLAQSCTTLKQAEELYESDAFQHALYIFKNFMEEHKTSLLSACIFLQKEIRKEDKEAFSMFLFILSLLIKDYYVQTQDCFASYQDMIETWNKEECLQIVIETKDKIIRSVNMNLLVDQFIYLWEVTNGK